jgi:hypothetical protein
MSRAPITIHSPCWTKQEGPTATELCLSPPTLSTQVELYAMTPADVVMVVGPLDVGTIVATYDFHGFPAPKT